jgi:hypothetical protein
MPQDDSKLERRSHVSVRATKRHLGDRFASFLLLMTRASQPISRFDCLTQPYCRIRPKTQPDAPSSRVFSSDSGLVDRATRTGEGRWVSSEPG